MADRNEADALFATKRKKQQEEQAEQERREEMSRKKAEMEAEIRRLEEEARRQKEQQEEARRQAQEEARRASEEAREAEARAARAEELAKQAQLKQEEVRREEERRARERKEEEEKRAREKKEEEERKAREKKEEEKRAKEKKEEEKQARERAAQEKAQAGQQEAQKAESGKQEAGKQEAGEKKAVIERKMPNIPSGKKLPVLPLAIGGAGIVVVIVICLILLVGGKKGGVFGTDCNMMAMDQVLGYTIYYPESFEEGYGDGGVLLNYGSVEEGDYSFVTILGDTNENAIETIGSSDPSDILLLLEYSIGMDEQPIYEMTTDAGQTVYCTEYFYQELGGLVYSEEEVMADVSLMVLPLGDEYLVAIYGTMKDSYKEPLEKAVTSILDNVY